MQSRCEQTQGCLNFDPRRAAGDQVVLFSCGGRADGGKSLLEELARLLRRVSADVLILMQREK